MRLFVGICIFTAPLTKPELSAPLFRKQPIDQQNVFRSIAIKEYISDCPEQWNGYWVHIAKFFFDSFRNNVCED